MWKGFLASETRQPYIIDVGVSYVNAIKKSTLNVFSFITFLKNPFTCKLPLATLLGKIDKVDEVVLVCIQAIT